MIYTLNKGVTRRLKERLARAAGFLLPVAASAFLGVAVFSYTVRHANGAVPNISKPNEPNSVVSSQTPNPLLGNPKASSTPSGSQPIAEASPIEQTKLPSAASLQPLSSGGMDGGSVPDTSSLQDSTSGNPVQTTVVIPPLDVQAGSKTIFSTDEISVTLN